MSFKDILVHIDDTPACGARLRFAAGLAQRQGGRLIGLHVIRPPETPPDLPVPLGQKIIDAELTALREAAARLEVVFNATIEGLGVDGEWRCVSDTDVVGQIAMNARYADLTVIGQRDPEHDDSVGNGDLPDELILAIGRPVVVVPHSGEHPYHGRRVLVAWDAGHAATRAVHDALPLLVGAEEVTVLSIDPRLGTKGHGEVVGGAICHHLARHGVHAKAKQSHADDGEVGDLLLSNAANEHADLMVMGAYGHNRLRELVMGGATRDVLAHMTIPVLMSH